MPFEVKIHPVVAEQDPVIGVNTSSYYSYRPKSKIEPVVSISHIASEPKPRQKCSGETPASPSQNRLVVIQGTSMNSSGFKTTKVVDSTNTSEGRGVVASIRYKIVPTVPNCDIPITEEFAPSALGNESDDEEEQNTLSRVFWTILFFLIAPFWCIIKAFYPLARTVLHSEKHNNNINKRSSSVSIRFLLIPILLAAIVYIMLAGNLGRESYRGPPTDNGQLPSSPRIHSPYVEEVRHFKREFHKLALEATKKVLSHPYELVRYGFNVEININYNWKQPRCNKKGVVFKNEVCTIKKKNGKKCLSDEFNRTNRTIVEDLKCFLLS
ncbi:943_t:CDS:1 [Acaulospora colombiana]|uniref:943_t:CDS:1 n=1 Tax=Acaulospora colombiana TaxID=27376 RepID=A0ACA9K9E4_9GLOM|nr:943_t:CDS:1 [Acaulospora colombiana]